MTPRPLFTLTLFARCTAKGVCRFFAWLRRQAEPPRPAPMDPLVRAQAMIGMLRAQVDDLVLERDVARLDGYRARCAEEWGGRLGGVMEEATWN